ncbi:T9SS type A sorting domain-containing protein [Fluviicola sp.]|uniref:T9SS type A sorting domain-containing protein n=1 Tax=Fluviicola sp. TaxID=1917219 RepID=UPI0031DD1C69
MVNRLLVIFFLFCSTIYAQDLGWTISNEGATSNGSYVEIDAAGNVYVYGSFSDSVDLDPSAGVAQYTTINSVTEPYLAKYDRSGNYLWSKKMTGFLPQGSERDLMVLDSQGNILLAVNFQDSLVDLNDSTYYSLAGSRDMGILKLDGNGNQLWFKLVQSSSNEWFHFIDNDNQDHLLLSGSFTGALDVDPGSGTEIISPDSYVGNFLLKLDESGAFEWVRTWNEGIGVSDLVIDTSRNIWITGSFMDTVDLDPSAGDFTVQNPSSNPQSFVLKLTPDGNFTWAKTIVSTILAYSDRIALTANNEAIIGGRYQGMVQMGSETYNLPNNLNAYLLKLDENGTVQWSRNIQCQGVNSISEIKVLSDGTILFLGSFYDTTYFMAPTTGLQLIPNNPYDTYCAWYNSAGDVRWATRFEGTGGILVMDLAKDSGDTVVMTGFYTGDFDFNLGPAVEAETTQSYYHGFVKKMYFDKLISLGIEKKKSIQISYSNPVNDRLLYQSDSKIEKASVFSLNGSLVREINAPAGEIDFQGIESGMYLVHFESGEGIVTARIVRL